MGRLSSSQSELRMCTQKMQQIERILAAMLLSSYLFRNKLIAFEIDCPPNLAEHALRL